jgi:hypothetical protein
MLPENKCPTAIRNDVLRMIYGGMLLTFPAGVIRDFWRSNRPPAIDPADEQALFKFLWQEDLSSPLEYLLQVLNGLEPLFLKHKLKIADFIKQTLVTINHGSIATARITMQWSKPLLHLFYSESDLRTMILRTSSFALRYIMPSIIHEPVASENKDSWALSTMILMMCEPKSVLSTETRKFGCEIPPYDCELWTATIVQMMPVFLSLPAFEEMKLLAEPRQMAMIVPGIRKNPDGTFEFAGKKIGIATTLHAFCQERGLDIGKYEMPNRPVVLATDDVFCPERGRMVIHKDCIYGSPVCLYQLRYRNDSERPKDFLWSVIDEITDEDKTVWKRIRALHKELLDSITVKASIIYNVEKDLITINGKQFVKYVPARILRKIFTTYKAKGQLEFDYSEIIQDPLTGIESPNPNIVIRIQRLCDLFKKKFPHISLAKTGRGKITMQTSCPIDFKEI